MCIRCVPYGICCSCRNCSMKRVKSTQHTKKEHRKRITRMREIEMQIERNHKTDSNGSGSGSDDDKIQTDGYEEFRLAIYSSQMNYNVRDLLRWRVFEMSAFVRVRVCVCVYIILCERAKWQESCDEWEREREREREREQKRVKGNGSQKTYLQRRHGANGWNEGTERLEGEPHRDPLYPSLGCL